MSKKTALYERSARPDPEYIRRQRNNLETYAFSIGLKDLQHFTDDGFSAFDYDRPGFSALRNAIQAKEVSVIVIKDIARISRDYRAFDAFAKMAEKNGVRLISITEKIDILPKRIHDDENGLAYTLNGDYYLPDILDPQLEDQRPLGKWGMMRLDYLKEHCHIMYTLMLLSGELHTHLADLDEQARNRHDLIVKQLAQAEGVTEQLKMNDQMAWVGMMNNIAARADEIIRDELIFN